MYFHLPAWLDLEKLFLAAIDSKSIKPIKKEHLYYILNLFIVVPSRNSSLLDEDGFLTLNGRLMQKYVRNYKQYINFFINEGLIVYPNQSGYKPGKMSKRYMLVKPDQYVPTPILIKATDSVLLKKYSRFLKRKNKIKSLHYLTKWIEEGGLEIQYQEALTWDTEQMNRKLRTNDWDEAPKKGKTVKKHPVEQSLYNRAIMQRIKHNDFYQSVDESGCRLHTNLTSLSKGLRSFLRYKGEPLGAIDIKNSQPFLSLVLLKSDFWSGANMSFSGFWKGREIKGSIYGSIKMLVESSHKIHFQEIKEFTTLVVQGTFYESFAVHLSRTLGKKFSRDEAKREMLRVLFSDNRFFIQDDAKAKQIFKEIFPFVYSVYCMIKKGNKPILACLLQQIESHLVLHVICKRISKEYPEAPIFTIHDSVVSTLPYLPLIQEIIQEELSKFVGHNPSLLVEYW